MADLKTLQEGASASSPESKNDDEAVFKGDITLLSLSLANSRLSAGISCIFCSFSVPGDVAEMLKTLGMAPFFRNLFFTLESA